MNTQQNKCIDFLENYRIDDNHFKEAYQMSQAIFRSKIKTALAFHENYYGFTTKFNEQSKSDDLFKISIQNSSNPNIFVVIDMSFTNPAKLIAALMPAILAKVENIYVIFFEDAPKALLTCLELMGLENVYLLHKEQKNSLLTNEFMNGFYFDLFLSEKLENNQQIYYKWTSFAKNNLICNELTVAIELVYIFKDLNLNFYQKTQLNVEYLI